jgi:hypothetical protein
LATKNNKITDHSTLHSKALTKLTDNKYIQAWQKACKTNVFLLCCQRNVVIMSDRIDPSSAALARQQRVRLAYTLNNEQPVRCTLVSEEPLFYIDAPIIEDEDSFALTDDAFLDDLFDEQPLLPMIEASAADAIDLFKAQFGGSPAPLSLSIDDLLAEINQSRLAQSLWGFARDHGVTLIIAPQVPAAFYDREHNIITLRAGLPAAEQILLTIRELRRVWQHRHGALINPLLFHPDHAIVINRVQAADCMTMMVRVAWELRLAGGSMAWDFLDQNGHADLTRSFAREALHDFRALHQGRAAAAAFETWFLSERCRNFDRTLIQQMLADYQSFIHKAGHEETSKVLTHQLVAALGSMPYGNNYLAPYAATILADPIFTDVRDRSNANFLWFIKFEQSFRQSERDLQATTSSKPASEGLAHAPTTATILAYSRPAASSPGERRVGTGGTIIELGTYRARRSQSD